MCCSYVVLCQYDDTHSCLISVLKKLITITHISCNFFLYFYLINKDKKIYKKKHLKNNKLYDVSLYPMDRARQWYLLSNIISDRPQLSLLSLLSLFFYFFISYCKKIKRRRHHRRRRRRRHHLGLGKPTNRLFIIVTQSFHSWSQRPLSFRILNLFWHLFLCLRIGSNLFFMWSLSLSHSLSSIHKSLWKTRNLRCARGAHTLGRLVIIVVIHCQTVHGIHSHPPLVATKWLCPLALCFFFFFCICSPLAATVCYTYLF